MQALCSNDSVASKIAIKPITFSQMQSSLLTVNKKSLNDEHAPVSGLICAHLSGRTISGAYLYRDLVLPVWFVTSGSIQQSPR